ncbi:MAG: tRNA (N6-isopentenyl adenosine(37)-C2)-methylthiotransferase MiaB, partial [Nitrospira sp.]
MKVYLETYGCQMNEYDSELVRSILTTAGNELTPRLDEAEAVLINTCAIRENAHRKIYGRLDLLRPLKKRLRGQGRDLVVGLLGCMAQNLKQELFKHPVLNLIVGPDNYRALPKLITRVKKQGSKEIDANLSEYETYRGIAPARVEGVNAWIAIMRGCDNFCSFCVVPYT